MKQVTEQILSELNSEEISNGYNNLISSSPTSTYGDITIVESFEKYKFLNELLRGAIENGTFEDLPLNRRNTVLSNLNSIRQYLSNVSQLIIQTDTLYDSVVSSGLLIRQIKQKDYQVELKNIANLKAELETLIDTYNTKWNIINSIDETKSYIDEILTKTRTDSEEIGKMKELSENTSQEIFDFKDLAENFLSVVAANEKEIESKKLSITTFSENIDEYKLAIDDLKAKATEVISKEKIIDTLISQAETALNLKSAQGISAAFSAQHLDASNKYSLRGWMIGASVFIIIALLLTIWIVSGLWIKDPNSISSIIGRVVAVGISITGATFCANQFTKQKNISEDYAYKAVLAKSIIAFTEEIKKRDDRKVAEYLAKVLDEIHKDPLRARSSKDEKTENLNPIELIEKLVDKLPGK